MVVNEADGYQPHIIAPENGYRRLIEDGLSLLRDPALNAIEQVKAAPRGGEEGCSGQGRRPSIGTQACD